MEANLATQRPHNKHCWSHYKLVTFPNEEHGALLKPNQRHNSLKILCVWLPHYIAGITPTAT